VFRATIHATEASDLESEVSALRVKCDRAGLSSITTDLLTKQVGIVLQELIANGRKLSALGSHMEATREIVDADYSVTLQFGTAPRRSWIQRLMGSLLGR
jgi:hypothetical protein